jgi:hypothetical protein
MDLNIRVIRANEFLKTTATGELDLQQSKEILLRLAAINAPPAKYDILLDVRPATGTQMTLVDIAELVDVMLAHHQSFQKKLAILTSQDAPLTRANFMKLYAGNRGLQVGAFKNFEEAINWLMESEELPTTAATVSPNLPGCA